MARILIVGGGCRGRGLAGELVAHGHAVRVTSRSESGRVAIEATGAECWIGDPDRIATLREALDRVTVACWMLGTATGEPDELQALFGTRLQYWLTQVIDTTVRGFVYESCGTVAPELLAAGATHVHTVCQRNSIPFAVVDVAPQDPTWAEAAYDAIGSFLRPAS